jgi:hypothetical protein
MFYRQRIQIGHQKQRKLLVCKLLSLLGISPEGLKFELLVGQIAELPIDNMPLMALELADEDILNEWVARSLEEHPYGRWFRAVPSFLKVKTNE